MKKFFALTILILALSIISPVFSSTQGMMGNNMMAGNGTTAPDDNSHTVQGEIEGKAIWEKLQAKELNCDNLSDEDFHNLGMYFMGLMAGDSHEAMDAMMEQMMGKEGENQMHIAMGKRMSGCDPNSPLPQNMMPGSMMPMMMNMLVPYPSGAFASRIRSKDMMGSWSNPNNSLVKMMNWSNWGLGNVWTWFGLIFMILFWILIVLGAVVAIKWLIVQLIGARKGKSALDILKERYVRGEISQEEFKEKKKDLS